MKGSEVQDGKERVGHFGVGFLGWVKEEDKGGVPWFWWVQELIIGEVQGRHQLSSTRWWKTTI